MTLKTVAPGADERSAPVASRRPRRRVGTVLGIVVVLLLLQNVISNPAFQWDIVRRYFTAPIVLEGLTVTIWLTVIALVAGFAIGTLLAVMRLSRSPVLVSVSWGYTWLFRSVPILVQLLFWYNISLLYPRLRLDVPFGPTVFDLETRGLVSGFAAAVIGLTLHEAAHAAEIVRGGLLSVERSQTEAAQALGLSRFRILWRIVLPQAMRAIIPPAANQATGLLKGTSVVSVIAGQDLLFATQLVYNRNYLVIPLLMVATLWYLILTTILSAVQYGVERYFGRGAGRTAPPTVLDRVRKLLPGGLR